MSDMTFMILGNLSSRLLFTCFVFHLSEYKLFKEGTLSVLGQHLVCLGSDCSPNSPQDKGRNWARMKEITFHTQALNHVRHDR